ncbi:hypothetical protein F2Q68_00016546 [Brassica cretica]|uniref:Uncharacterized protein n=1 Tax=Brassica cretica TaxID=69181 RepID=A0A8S9HRL6_BRACR|nr:hypothetical protein F2Q68_00016546 [Brassica cretica]
MSQIHLLPSLLTRLRLIPQARSSNTQQNSMEVKVKLCLLTAAAHLRLTTLVTPETLDVDGDNMDMADRWERTVVMVMMVIQRGRRVGEEGRETR